MKGFFARLLTFGAPLLVFGALASATSSASVAGSISLDSSAYIAHENQGYLTVTIHRTDTSGSEQIRYGVKRNDAQPGIDFDTIPNTYVELAPGQADYTFQVRIYDLGMNAPAVHAQVYLFGSYPQTLGTPNKADITILHDDPLGVRDPANPLGVATPSAFGDPLTGATFYAPGAAGQAGQAQARYQQSKPAWAKALSVLAGAPTGNRFYFWNEPADPAGIVSHALENYQVAQPNTTVQLTTYSLVHGQCAHGGHAADSPAFVTRYQNWVDGLARGIGNFHVVMFFELDSLITSSCLSEHGKQVRFQDELAYGIRALEADPHVVVYLDAGAADASSWQTTASELNRAGVHQAQGFFLNATHFDWTTSELAYGQRISRALGGVHFVINTGENGRGPLAQRNRVKNGNEVLCNPPGRGLGPFSTSTGYRYADAFLWFSNPGGSGGACRPGAPPTAVFWPAYAVSLVANARYDVTGPHLRLARQGTFIPQQPGAH